MTCNIVSARRTAVAGGLIIRLKCFVERLAAQVEPDDVSLGVDQIGRWDRANAEGFDQVRRSAGVVHERPRDVACLGEVDDGGFRLVEADADDLESVSAIGAVGGLQPGKLADARSAPGGPEIDQDVLAAVGLEPHGLSFDVFHRERRSQLADLVQPFQVVLHFLPQVGTVAESIEQQGVDLARGRELAGGDGRGGEIIGEAGGELFLLVLAEPLHELFESFQGFVKLARLSACHRQDDLGERLDGPVGIALQVLPAQLFGFAEPIVLDRLVEKGRIGLVAIIGLGVLPQVFRQLVDEGPVVLGLNRGDVGRRGLGRSRTMSRTPSLRSRRNKTRSWISSH